MATFGDKMEDVNTGDKVGGAEPEPEPESKKEGVISAAFRKAKSKTPRSRRDSNLLGVRRSMDSGGVYDQDDFSFVGDNGEDSKEQTSDHDSNSNSNSNSNSKSPTNSTPDLNDAEDFGDLSEFSEGLKLHPTVRRSMTRTTSTKRSSRSLYVAPTGGDSNALGNSQAKLNQMVDEFIVKNLEVNVGVREELTSLRTDMNEIRSSMQKLVDMEERRLVGQSLVVEELKKQKQEIMAEYVALKLQYDGLRFKWYNDELDKYN